MKNVVAKVKHNDINDIGAFTTSLFNQNQEVDMFCLIFGRFFCNVFLFLKNKRILLLLVLFTLKFLALVCQRI